MNSVENEILEKINNGNTNLTDDDFFYISNNTKLKEALVMAIGKNILPIDLAWKDIIIEDIINEIDLTVIPKDILSSFCFQVIESLINSGYYSYSFSTFYESFNFDQETNDKFKKYLEDVLDDRSKTFDELDMNTILLIKLLNHKRYDIINNIKEVNYSTTIIDEAIYKRIINEWPYDKKPEIAILYEKSKGIYKYSINDDLEDLFDSYFEYSNQKNEIYNVIIDKINSLPSVNYLTENKKMNALLANISLKDDNFTEILKLLFNKDYLIIADDLLKKGIITQEELNKKIDYCIDNHLNVPYRLIDIGDYRFRSDKCIKLLIDYGYLDSLLLEPKKILDEIDFKSYIPYIIEKINNNDPYYEKYLTYIDLKLNDYPEIFTAIVNKKKVKRITLRNLILTDETIDDVIRAIDYNKDLFISNDMMYDNSKDKLTKKLFEHNYYDIIANSNLFSYGFVNRNLDYVLDKLDNTYFADLIIKNNSYVIKRYKEIILKLLDNPNLVDKIIELIVHEDDIDELYNEEIFEKIKNYSSKANNLNSDNLEKIKNHFGLKIIRYLDNDNLRKIINLDDESFNKIIGLFPIVEYNMNDLEAGFESLIQYLYGKRNTEDITIFPRFIHSLEDNNIDEIKKIKERLIIYVKKESLLNVCNKHNLNNIISVEELVNLIIQKYNTEERNKYIEILHDLTNEFILTSRENYRNNHFFEKQYPTFFCFFDKVLNSIDTEQFLPYVKQISSRLDNNFYKEFSKNKNITDELKDPINLLKHVIEKIKVEETRNKYLPVLKEIIDYYYQKERKRVSKLLTLGAELSLPYELDEKSKRNEIIRYFIETSFYWGSTINGFNLYDLLVNAVEQYGIDSSMIDDCISYYKGSKNCSNDIKEVQKNMSIVIKEASKIVKECIINSDNFTEDNEQRIIDRIDLPNSKYDIKRTYYIKDIPDLYQILLNLNIDLLKNGLFKNEEVYNKLVEIMRKKKLHLLPNYLNDVLDECDISSDYGNISAFINFFMPIYEYERKKSEASGKDEKTILSGLASILINAETYDSISNIYSQILGEKDSKLIKANPGPNSAVRKTKDNQRLIEAIELTKDIYKRNEITVPTFDLNVSCGNEKKQLNAIVGNFTDPSNLTHGERTGACMRIGGIGESLFNFCLHDKNGFHIRFEDPNNHEYISRVSGFRNGNTVFLNELRYSCNSNSYSNQDVVNACRETAKIMIEMSKESECPIENVVISNQYAMSGSGMREISLGITDNKEGLQKFYSDVGTTAIILATSSNDKEFVPINFDKTKVLSYKTCRSKPIVSTDSKEIIGKINRVASIKTLLESSDDFNYEDIGQIEFENGFLCGVVSDDWYIYVDNNKQIFYDYIEVDERAKTELAQYIVLIDEMINKAVEKKEMEGDIYGL